MTVTALRDTLERSGILRDDPLHQYLVVLEQTLEEDRVLRTKDRTATRSELASLIGEIGKVADYLKRQQRVASSIHLPAPWRRYRLVWAVALGLAFMVGAASGGWAGHALGHDARRSRLEAINDLDMLAQACEGAKVRIENGRHVCQTWIWLDGPK